MTSEQPLTAINMNELSVGGVGVDGDAIVVGSDADALAPPSGEFDAVDLGNNFACGILTADSTLTCWGATDDEWLNALRIFEPPSGSFISLSVGKNHACALAVDGFAHCWGQNEWGQASSPRHTRFISVAAGSGHSCGVTTKNI